MGALPSTWMAFVSIHNEDKDLNLQNLITKLKQERANLEQESNHTTLVASIRNQQHGSSFSLKPGIENFKQKI